MISAIGNKREHPSSGFSLIEILLVLALVAVAGSIVIYNFAAFADRDGSLDTKETVHAAIRKGTLPCRQFGVRGVTAHDQRPRTIDLEQPYPGKRHIRIS
jgi:prepilin-type N-terminal cleavage/methylation domain-containing protein